jgi:hypothetical protein
MNQMEIVQETLIRAVERGEINLAGHDFRAAQNPRVRTPEPSFIGVPGRRSAVLWLQKLGIDVAVPFV